MKASTFAAKVGLAEMLKGGVIMDVVNAEQARIAEDAGACAVMALERVPAQIRKDGGVARASDPAMIKEIQATVSIPVMAKCRIDTMEARILEALEVDFIDESEVLTPADDDFTSRSMISRCPSCVGVPTRRSPPPHWRRGRFTSDKGRSRYRQYCRGCPPSPNGPRAHPGLEPNEARRVDDRSEGNWGPIRLGQVGG